MAITLNFAIIFKGPEIVDVMINKGPDKIINRLGLPKSSMYAGLNESVNLYEYVAIVYHHFPAAFFDCSFLDIV